MIENPFTIEEDWSSVYIDVVKKLRRTGDNPFRSWLENTAVKPPLSDLDSYFERRGWDNDHHAVQLVELAGENVYETVGLLLAIRTPVHETLRLAFPSRIEDFRDYRVVFPPKENNKDWFPRAQRVRHQHAQINCSDRFGPRSGNRICSGMLWASMIANKPLYCGDVSRLETDDPTETLGSEEHNIPRFLSVGVEQEKFLGVSSILFIPVRSDSDSKEADLVLGLYSPIPNVFGNHKDFSNSYCDPKNRFCEIPSPNWLKDFTDRFLLSRILPTLLTRIDDAYRRGMYDFAEIVELTHTKVDSIVEALKSEATKLQKTDSESIHLVVNKFLNAIEYADRDDPHHRILELYRQVLDSPTRLKVQSLTAHDIGVIYRYQRTQNDVLVSCGADERRLLFESIETPQLDTSNVDAKYLENNPVAEAVASILNGYIKNASNAGSESIIIRHEMKGDRILFSVENDVDYSEERIRQYWIVRQGHIARGNNRKQQSGTHGLTLYLTRELSPYLNIECEFLMRVPELDSDESVWISTVSAPFQMEKKQDERLRHNKYIFTRR